SLGRLLHYMSCPTLIILRHPRTTLFPYTTLFRSQIAGMVTLPSVAGAGWDSTYDEAWDINNAGQAVGLSTISLSPALPSLEHARSEEHTSELQSHLNLVCRLLLEKKKK